MTDLDLHGPVYCDDELGGFAVNADGSRIAYVAEKKQPKNVPFCKTTNGNGEDKKKDEVRLSKN